MHAMYNIVQADIRPLKVVELKGVDGHFVIVTIYCTGGRSDRPQIHIIAYCLTTGDTYDVQRSRIINVLDLELTQTQMDNALNLCGDFAVHVLDIEHKRLPKYKAPKTRQRPSVPKTAGAEVNKPARGAKIRARRKLRAERERQAKEEQKKTEQDEQLRKKKVQQKKTEQKKTEQKKKELLLHQRKLAKRANREAKREAKREAERSQALREAEEWRAKELALETEISKLRKSLLREKPAATPEEPQVSHREKELKAQATRIAKLEAEISRLSEAPDRGRKSKLWGLERKTRKSEGTSARYANQAQILWSLLRSSTGVVAQAKVSQLWKTPMCNFFLRTSYFSGKSPSTTNGRKRSLRGRGVAWCRSMNSKERRTKTYYDYLT